ncbi:MAG: metallophosphoesterase family protein [Parvularculaceae bacterium]|nr:serine/threonine protein phosphatase [Parvularculaceae bacterium]
MLNKLFGGGAPKSRAPDGVRLYAVGDIHGCAALLGALLELIEKDSAGAPARLIFLGDYVDRGADSKGVIDALLKVKAERPDSIFLKGNHEQAMLDFLERPDLNEEWLHWGGDKTLESYGVGDVWTRRPDTLARDFARRLPEAHRSFLRELTLYEVLGDYAFVHAGFKPGLALDAQAPEDCLWIRSAFHNARADERPDKIVVHGHHPVKKPLDAGWRIDVDTGAVWSGALTAIVLEGATRRFISTGKI